MKWLYGLLVAGYLSQRLFAAPLTVEIGRLDATAQQALKKGSVVGCAIAVVKNDKIVFIKAYGNKRKSKKEPVDTDTVFQLGSTAKAVTSSLVAVLETKGLIDWNRHVNKDYPFLNPATTLKHLLSHSAGFNRAGWNQRIESGMSRKQIIAQLSKTKQKFPGKSYDYHNVVFSLVEDVLEKTQRTSFANLMKVQLFKPIGMNRATVGFQEFSQQANRAWPHVKRGKRSFFPASAYSRRYHESVASAGGINASVKDMAAFLKLQLGAYPQVLDDKHLQTYHEPLITVRTPWTRRILHQQYDSNYGLGWRVFRKKETRIVFHSGWVAGFTSAIGFLPREKVGVVVLHNVENGFASKTVLNFLDNVSEKV